MQDLAALIPGACVKTFPLSGGDTKELVVFGNDAGPIDWPPLAPLALPKEEWFAAIDRAVMRIREVLDGRPNSNRLAASIISPRYWNRSVKRGHHLPIVRPLPAPVPPESQGGFPRQSSAAILRQILLWGYLLLLGTPR